MDSRSCQTSSASRHSRGDSHCRLGLCTDVIAQGHQTFLAYPTLPCFKPVPQKLEPLTFDTAISNMSFVRM
jgi:hypothetical protein